MRCPSVVTRPEHRSSPPPALRRCAARSFARVVALAAVSLLALGVGGGVARAARNGAQLANVRTSAPGVRVARFTAPQANSLVASGSVTARIVVGSRVTGVSVWLGTRNVSSRFVKRGLTFTARLPRSVLRVGQNRLLAQARTGSRLGGAASVSFIVGRRAPALMRVTALPKPASGLGAAPPTTPNLGLAAGQVPVTVSTRTPTQAVLTVNGHRVAAAQAAGLQRTRTWLISRRDGLRFGVNRLVLTTWNASGGYAVKRWQITRSRRLPMAEAGPAQRVIRPHGWAALNGTGSLASRAGATLSYRWQIVGAPAGAKARLVDPTSAKPRIRTGAPGIYQVALSVTQRPGKASKATSGATGRDLMTLDAVPALGPQGLYVDTGLYGQQSMFTPPYNSLWVEGQPYTDSTNGVPDTWVQLDASTLAVIASGNHRAITPRAGTITIGQWQGVSLGDISWDPTVAGAQDGSQVWLGTTLIASNSTPKAPASGTGNPTTALRGWLTPAASDSASNYSWFGSDLKRIQTRSAGDTATTNTIQIDDQSFPQSLPDGATGGYQLVVLDNNGEEIIDELFSLYGDPARDEQTENSLASTISSYPHAASIVLQAFGIVPSLPADGQLANVIQSIGGRADVVDRFTGTPNSTGGVYALIAGTSPGGANSWSPGWRAIESSYERTGTSGALSALLARDSTGDAYVPYSGYSSGLTASNATDYAFLPLAYAPPSSWADWVRPLGNANGQLSAPTTAESAAYSDMLTEITNNGWLPSTMACPNAPDALRGFYCTTDASKLINLKSQIANQLPFDAGVANGRYQQGDWNIVQQSIEDELSDVITIRSSIATYQQLFGTSTVDGSVNVSTIGDAVKQQIKTATTAPTNARLFNILSGLTDIASVIPEIGPPMTFISGVFTVASSSQPDTSAETYLGTEQVTQDTAATALLNAMQNVDTQLNGFGDDVVADPVKLEQANAYFLNNTPDTTSANSTFVLAAEYATQQWLWGTLLAPEYTAWSVPTLLQANPACNVFFKGKGWWTGQPWGGVSPTTNTWASSSGEGSANTTADWIIGLDSGAANNTGFARWNQNGGGLTPAVTNAIFGPVDPTSGPTATTGAGAIMPYFALNYLPIKAIPVMPESDWHFGTSGGNGCYPNKYVR